MNNADALIADRIDGMHQNEPLALRAMIHRLETPPYNWPADKILAVLQPYKAEILKYIERKFRVSHISLPLNDIKKLLGTGVNWPELDEIVNKYKTPILKKMLEWLKDDYKPVVDPLNTLMLMNMPWHELDIMQRSIDARRNHINESHGFSKEEISNYAANLRSDIHHKHYYSVLETLADMSSVDMKLDIHDATSIKSSLEKHQHGILKILLSWMKELDTTGITRLLPSILAGFEHFDIKWPALDVIKQSVDKMSASNNSNQLDEIIDPHTYYTPDESYIRFIRSDIKSKDYLAVLDDLSEISMHDDIGDVADITQGLEQHKQGILRKLLSMMLKNNTSELPQHVPQILTGFAKFGITWPELDVIRKSVDKIALSYDADYPPQELDEELNAKQQQAEAIKRDLAIDVIQNDMERVPEDLSEFAWFSADDYGDTTQLKGIFEHYKTRVMKTLLGYLRELDNAGAAYIMPQILEGLKNIGITWNELKIIQTSVDLMIQQSQDDEDAALDEGDNEQETRDIISEYIDVPWLLVREFNRKGLTVANGLVANSMAHVKTELIRELLNMMKKEEHTSVPYNVGCITATGVHWPELDTIVSSAKAEIKKDRMRYGFDESKKPVNTTASRTHKR